MDKAAEHLKKSLGLQLREIEHFNEAMTHSSCEDELNNKKLALLGDAVLDLVVTSYILKNYPDLSIGEITEKRASIVNSRFLSEKAREWQLNRLLKLGRGERQTGGQKKETILAEAVEALIGALYTDYGLKKSEEFIEKNAIPETIGLENWNAKGKLQELSLSKHFGVPEYSVTLEKGTGNTKTFEVKVKINGNSLGKGEGRSKKEAEVMAAREALEILNTNLCSGE